MSGIAGILYFDRCPDAARGVARMLRPLAMLGPDRQGLWDGGDIALGVRQMMLLPEDRFDRQPWTRRNGNLVVVAVGRLDNRDEIADALGQPETDRRVRADSELLATAIEHWDLAALDRAIGEFAYAAWDVAKRRLHLVRAHLAGPAIYYHASSRFFAFATTPSALFALPDVPRALNERHVARHLMLDRRATDETYYRDISCVQPAHRLEVSADGLRTERYWRLDPDRELHLRTDEDYVLALREHFARAVAARLRSIHPVGSLLSSGCDSSAVTAVAAHQLASQQKRLIAFTAAPREGSSSVGLAGRPTDESEGAAQTVAHLGNVDHVVVRGDGRTLVDGLNRAHLLYEMPTIDQANRLWIEHLLDVIRERRVRVVLTGSAGNITISYDGLPWLATLMRSGQWLTLMREALALRRNGMGKAGILRRALGPFLPPQLWRRASRIGWPGLSVLEYSAIHPDFLAQAGLASDEREWNPTSPPLADSRALRWRALERNKEDAKSGILAGWGIDMRDPTRDRRVVEFCLAIPENQYLRHGETKFLYRRTFGPMLPPFVSAARPRAYQGGDWHEGLMAAHGQILEELRRCENSEGARRILDLPRLRRLVDNWPTGGWHETAVTIEYRLILMRAVAVGSFIRWVEGANT